jgi:hypothetical protein
MLLIMLAETQALTKTAFNMPVERAQEWYGISERTAERGYGETAPSRGASGQDPQDCRPPSPGRPSRRILARP